MPNASHTATPAGELPVLLAGPIVRYARPQQITLWLVCSIPVKLHVLCMAGDTCIARQSWPTNHPDHIVLGKHAHLHLLQLRDNTPFPTDCWLSYDIGFERTDGHIHWLRDIAPHLLYDQQSRPGFIIKSQINQVLHGSCRKPHHDGKDGFLCVDQALAEARVHEDPDAQPALLLMSGDQVYVDDVAGPMLHAIHQVIAQLGLFDETLQGTAISDSRQMYASKHSYYQRARLLPDTTANSQLHERFFAGARKPIFTTSNADNHLITLAEVIAMYLLVWSPVLWRTISLEKTDLPAEYRDRYHRECEAIWRFSKGLEHTQRALAHIPVHMIFDDHDITDDWNLTRGWEESAYGHPFSRRIIGNALIGYALCQAWGNTPDNLPDSLLQPIKQLGNTQGDQRTEHRIHDELITRLLKFEGWQYTVDTSPKLVVLDTRTRRWRSESSTAKPSGLMDWEALSEVQQQLIHEQAVILVSAAPIFGVKLIEVIQRIFTWFGHALTVDAENWMSHPGAANVILNIFRHKRTPHHFVILSGDVHYSFAYDVRLRHREQSPHIWQISSSGIKNTFPDKLLRPFDRMNRWLFASRSPLNWLTRRRHMRIRPRRPSDYSGRYRHQRLVNGNGIGRVYFDDEGTPVVIETLLTNGEIIRFTEGYEDDWVE